MGLTQSRCERNAIAKGVANRVRFEEGSAHRLPYADGEFDAVVSNYVFHEVREQKDKLALLREALRVLRPGGAFAFQDPFGIKPIYRDLDGLIAKLRADGLASAVFSKTRWAKVKGGESYYVKRLSLASALYLELETAFGEEKGL